MLLEIKNLCKAYQQSQSDVAAVHDVNLSLAQGDFVCITGHSGGGKSTLLGMIAGLLRPTAGTITFDGREITGLNDRALSYLRNTEIGYIPQGHSALSNFTVLDNIRLPFYLHKRTGDPTEQAQQLLSQVGLSHLAAAYPARLSGGELRRISIARSLINNPKLLIADEPTGDLDPQNAVSVMELFSRIAQGGTTILLVTHDTELVRYGGRHLHMERGNLSEKGGSSPDG